MKKKLLKDIVADEHEPCQSMAHAKDHLLKGGKWVGKSCTILSAYRCNI